MKQYTDITVLVDRSGSMRTIKEAMETAFEQFVEKHRVNPSTRLTLIQFDDVDDHYVQYSNAPINSAEPLRLRPRGNTPLLDAFVKAIDATGRRLAGMDASERPDQVLFVVITDGEENASRIYKRWDVSQRVNTQRDRYNWEFVYLGANQDAFKEAASLGFLPQYVLAYAAAPATATASLNSVASNTVKYASSTGATRGLKSYLNFDEEQRKKAVEDSKISK